MSKSAFLGLALAMAWPAVAAAQVFECSFVQENVAGGKSNMASCAMHPEDVFNSVEYKPNPREFCRTEPVFIIEDLRNVRVDLEARKASWVVVHKMADSKKRAMIDFYSDSNPNRRSQAEDIVNVERESSEEFDITGAVESQRELFYDSATKKELSEHKPVTDHILTLVNKTAQHVLYIPEWNGEAILTSYSSDDRHSVARIRFGTCTIEK